MMSKNQVSDFLLFHQKMDMLLYLNNRHNHITESSGNLQPGELGGNNYFGYLEIHFLRGIIS